MNGLKRAAVRWLTAWSSRRHGTDRLPHQIDRRRIYIVPTRFGCALALLLTAMLLAALNYNSNLGLAFGFLMVSVALVSMHHCHRNLLGLAVDTATEVDSFAGADAALGFVLRNDSALARVDIEVECDGVQALIPAVPARDQRRLDLRWPTARRGLERIERFELRTRFPFGWFRAWTYVHRPITVFVAPHPVGDQNVPVVAGPDGSATAGELRGDEEFSGLRPYVPGMSLKHMAWKVFARGAAPAVRIYSGVASQPEWLDWDSLSPLDSEVRLAQLCRWILSGERERRCYGLRMPGVAIAPGQGVAHRTECLRALAAHATDAAEPQA